MNFLEQLATDLAAASTETDKLTILSVCPKGSSPFLGRAVDECGEEFDIRVCLNLENGTAWLSNGWCMIGEVGRLSLDGMVTK